MHLSNLAHLQNNVHKEDICHIIVVRIQFEITRSHTTTPHFYRSVIRTHFFCVQFKNNEPQKDS